MRRVLAAAAVMFTSALLTWLSFGAINPREELFDRALAALDDFAATENRLQSDVLTARAGMLRNYDPVVRETHALGDALGRLRRTAPRDTATRVAIDVLTASVERQQDLVEQFKSNNALLQNSLAYFAMFSRDLERSDRAGALVSPSGALSAAMLRLTLDGSPANARDVEDRLKELMRTAPGKRDARSVKALLAHGRLLHDLLPATDDVMKALIVYTQARDIDAVRIAITARQTASRSAARQFRLMLYATSLLLLGILVYLGLQLRRRAQTLRERAAFEHVIAVVSKRFINAPTQDTGALIEQALAQMAQCIGADRAYFLLVRPSSRTHTWCRAGTSFPRGWPTQAPALLTRAPTTAAGVLHVPRIDRLANGDCRDALAAFGLAGWLCVFDVDGAGVSGLLGFDALHGSCRLTRSGELSLVRTALDTINDAIEREFIERERASLQQARRMETIGAFASGIAHNFSNIIGAILGYTEMVEAQIEPQSRLGRQLGEIRRSGMRALDLVEQILTFGRRGAVRRTHLELSTLIMETTSLLRASLPSRITLIANEAPDAGVIHGEFAHLQQVILNLCNNAAQAIEGAGAIEIETEAMEVARPLTLSHGDLAPGRYARISIRDKGRGMDGATLEQIFEPFFTTRPEGHGLGLATVREIVGEHGGVLDVWSEVGRGSRFDVWLPSIAVASVVSHQSPRSRLLGHGETVLLINDDRSRLIHDEETLAALGYEPIGYTCPNDALAVCEEAPERFDAIVIGHLPAPSAIDLAVALNRLAPSLPIVLAASPAEDFDTSSLGRAGVRERVRYPLSTDQLAGALARCWPEG